MSLATAALMFSSVVVEVGNIRNDHGTVRVSICPKPQWLADKCPYEAHAPAAIGVTRVTIPGVPPGDYGATAFHDENDNDKVDRGLFGIPKEGVGFSRDAPIRMKPPQWADAVFTHKGPQTIAFKVRYFMGPQTPAEWAGAHRGEK